MDGYIVGATWSGRNVIYTLGISIIYYGVGVMLVLALLFKIIGNGESRAGGCMQHSVGLENKFAIFVVGTICENKFISLNFTQYIVSTDSPKAKYIPNHETAKLL